MKKVWSYIFGLIIILFLIQISVFVVWAVIFDCYFTAMIWLLFIAAIVISIKKLIKLLIVNLLIMIGMIVLILSTAFLSIQEVNHKISQLAQIPRNQKSPDLFNWKDCAGIYGLNLWMGILAFPFYPEASVETLCMFLPGKEKRIFHVTGIPQSGIILEQINKREAILTDRFSNQSTALRWDESEYSKNPFGKEARYSLAFNGGRIWTEKNSVSNRNGIQIRIEIDIRYPKNSYVTLLRKPKLQVEEGLFWVLQEKKWLHPYKAVWIYSE